jgi:hypothetical protein
MIGRTTASEVPLRDGEVDCHAGPFVADQPFPFSSGNSIHTHGGELVHACPFDSQMPLRQGKSLRQTL